MTSLPDRFQFNRIGIVHSPFRQKFGIPRQPGLCPSIPGQIELLPPYNHRDMLRGLDGFSHIWVLFVFNAIAADKWTPLVRPPRLGGKERMGVFATRSTHRPNPIGQSVVKLDKIEISMTHPLLHISGHDLLHETPVIDIKPYIPYADAVNHAVDGFIARTAFKPLAVEFNSAAAAQCRAWEDSYPGLRHMLTEILRQDPRPAYHKKSPETRDYGLRFYDLNVRYRLGKDSLVVQDIQESKDT